ncbi:MAG: alkaline phosphatase family protein [Pirellulaceae bacterium]
MRKKVLLIGWDAADWKIMKPLMEAGQMPCTSRFVENGVMGNLATLKPVLSPMLWNSIATGKRPDKHGILGFTEFNPHTGQVSPSLSTSRKVKALWNMASQEGLKSHVVNWFASHPAEPINGVCVTETYSTPPKKFDSSWTLTSESIHPAKHFDALKEIRLHPKELDENILKMFCPLAGRVDQTKDRRLESLATQIAEAINVHSAATYILENEEWDFLAVYYGAIDHFCHLFMNFHPPKRSDVTDADYEIYHDVINNCYRFHDVMLTRLLELAGPDATVIVCSDHGFRSDHLRPPYTPRVPAGPAYWHRDQGILMMQGPGIKKDELVHGATLLDIAPTTLSLLGLPVARDFEGRVLSDVFDGSVKISWIDSWEQRSGTSPDGMHPENVRMSPEASKAIIDQFVALGYIDELDENADRAALAVQREAKWNLAISQLDAGNFPQAIELLLELVEENPDRKDIIITLANCLQGTGMNLQARKLTELTLKHDVDAAAANHTLAEVALAEGDAEQAYEYLQRSMESSHQNNHEFPEFYELGRSLTLGSTFLKLGRWQEALHCFARVLELDPDHVRALHGSARALIKLKQNDEALDLALRSVELEYRSYLGHYLLGMAFARIKNWERAVQAFTVAIRFNPNHAASWRLLSIAYTHIPGQNAASKDCQDTFLKLTAARSFAKKNRATDLSGIVDRLESIMPRIEQKLQELADQAEKEKEQEANKSVEATATKRAIPKVSDKEFLVVSGLPRSGTSLMMQMLYAGGIPAMTDELRKADVDNPKGYFEWEEIKKLKTNPEIIERAEGKATKVISMLLPFLPHTHRYKIIFMLRPIDEVVASQRKMIERLQTEGAKLDEADLVRNLTLHRDTILKTMQTMPANVYILKYENLVTKTKNVVESLVNFLGDNYQLDTLKMIDQVKPELWRNRTSTH